MKLIDTHGRWTIVALISGTLVNKLHFGFFLFSTCNLNSKVFTRFVFCTYPCPPSAPPYHYIHFLLASSAPLFTQHSDFFHHHCWWRFSFVPRNRVHQYPDGHHRHAPCIYQLLLSNIHSCGPLPIRKHHSLGLDGGVCYSVSHSRNRSHS
jgi:hypothetical protein